MELTPSEKYIVCMKFDSYVKKCCKNELRNIEAYENRIRQREISVPNITMLLRGKSKEQPLIPDFTLDGCEIVINDSLLLMALEKLLPRERELILLIYFMGFKPNEISLELNVSEKTIYNRKNNILLKLKQIMEGLE